MTKTFDPKCYDLAHSFIEDRIGVLAKSSDNLLVIQLASDLQQVIDDFCAGLDLNRSTGD